MDEAEALALLAARLAAPDTAGLADGAAAEALNLPDAALPARRVDVATAEVRGLLLATGEWGAVTILARQAVAPEDLAAADDGVRNRARAVAAAITVMDTIKLTDVLEASRPAYWAAMQAIVAGMTAAGVLSEGTGAAMLALGERPQSWAEANGVAVDARAVGLARGGRA